MRGGRVARRAAAGGIRGHRADAALRGARTGPRRGARPRRRTRIFAAWFQAAHRASQEHAAAFETTLAGGHTIVLTPARLRALGTAPPGLPDAPGRNATFAFGVIADGTPRGIPMAFGVLEPSPGRRRRARGSDSRGCAWLRPRRSGFSWQWRSDGAASAGDRGGARPFARTRRAHCHGRSRPSISGAGALPARAARPGVSEPAGNRPRHEFRRPGQSCGPEYR